MKLIMEGWRQFINESGLSRVRKHIMNHDCAILTAFRGDLMDMENCTDNAEMPEEGEKNMNRNRDLKATLLGSGYGVTKVDGSYVEDFDTPKAMEVKENSLFCVNLKDDPSFIQTIATLGEKYCQDSVLIIPKGGKGSYLLGTNEAEFPGYGQKEKVGDLSFGKEAEFMTRVKGRPFSTSESLDLETYDKLPKNQRMFVRAATKRILSQ